jgi:hypothetical protein
MAYDEGVAQRIREIFGDRNNVIEKKMFGGLAFLLNGNMCCGVVGDTLMARVGAERYGEALERPHAREMDFTGRSLKGFVYVAPEGFAEDEDLRGWAGMCVDFVASLPAK